MGSDHATVRPPAPLLALLIAGLTPASHAATVVCADGTCANQIATGIEDLDILGNLYDVTFVRGFPADEALYGDPADFQVPNALGTFVVDQINGALTGVVNGVFDDASDNDFYRIATEFQSNDPDNVLTYSGENINATLDWVEGASSFEAYRSAGSPDVYAIFSTTVVPVPAAVWLFGSALGLLGWIRRRAN